MPLSLTVPALEDKPAITAETRPKQIQELIAGLPADRPQESARLVLEELGRLNRQQVSVDARLQALELYRRTILDIAQGLAGLYCNQPLPLLDDACAQVRTAQLLLIELAYGYKHAILATEQKLFSLGGGRRLALLIQRTLHTLGHLQLIAYQAYMTPSAGIWAEMHQLYLYALQQSLQDIPVDDGVAASSINLAYKRTLLLSLANTHHLTSIDIGRVVDYLERFAQHAQLQPFGKPESPAGVFMVSLNSGKPPVPLGKVKGEADLRTDILLITVDLARQVHNHLTLLQANEPPRHLGLPDIALDQRYQDMLAHLLLQWGTPPKRLFNRVEKNDVVDMCVGIPAIHHFLGGGAPNVAAAPNPEETELTLNFADSPIDSGGGRAFHSARWMVVNESAGGMALNKLPDAHVALRIGELLGLKTSHASQWSLAVLRWASSNEDAQMGVGAQLLAPDAQAVMVRPVDQSKFEMALLLPALPALKQPVTLVVARGVYKPARELQLDENGEKSSILVTRLIERTNSFERFQFSRL